MDVTYNNVLESTRQYFQGVPPAATGVGHGGQHAGGVGGGGLALFNNIPSSAQQPQANGPTNYYHQAHQQQAHQHQTQQHQTHQLQAHQHPSHPHQAHQHQAHQQQVHHQVVPQRHAPAQQNVQPVPSYLTNGGLGSAGKPIYSPSPQPSPSPHHQDNLRIQPGAPSISMYNPHPQPSPSPQEHRLSANSSSKSMYNPHPQPSPSPQENIRLPSMSPFNNIPYQSQLQQAQRNRHTPTAPSPLPPISQLKGHASSASPSPAAVPSSGNYQRQSNGQGGRFSSGSNYYASYQHQSLLQQQHDLQQQQQQLQQQLHQQQQEELKQQQAFYSGLTNSSQQHQPPHHQVQPQHHPPSQYTPSNLTTSNRTSTTPVNAGVNLSRTPTNSSNSTAPTVVKRESPLDLSVKTVRQSADSTGQMESSNSESGTTFYYFQQEGMRGHPSLSSGSNQQSSSFQSYATLQPATTPKVDFSPNFSQHAHILQSHQQQQQQQHQQQPHHPHQQQAPPSQPLHHSSHRQQQIPSQPQSSLAHHQQVSHLHHQQSLQSQVHSMQQSYDKHRWKDSGQAGYQLPSMSSVVKVASGNHSSHIAGGNTHHTGMAGTSGNINHLSGHYHVNQLGQSIPKPTYPQDPSRYAQNYLKRPPSGDQSKMSAPTAPKQSRHDNWKATIDQQIEKRFNSYLSSKGIVNGDMGKPAIPPTSTSQPAYPMPSARNYYDHQQVPNQHSHHHDFTVEKSSHHQPSNNSGSGNGAADKRVLSILRNSLETKEARLQQQQQLQMAKSPLQYTELTTRPTASTQQPHTQSHRHSLPAMHSVNAALERGPPTAFPRLSIPKAVNSIQESNKSVPPYHGSSQHLPSLLHHQQTLPAHQHQQQHAMMKHAMMAPRQPNLISSKASSEVVDITHEDEDASALARLSASKQSVPQASTTPQPPAHQGSSAPPIAPPTTKSGEFDGLAAFLAARIRTKAELKQQPSSEQPATPGSSSLTSASLSSSNFRSPFNDLVKTPGPTSDLLSTNSKCSPWTSSPKMAKDQPLAASFPRRRLFSKGEEDQPSNADTEVPPVGALPPTSASLPPRTSSSHRSSSETSVFDFRESDSEGEAPTLERQPGRRLSVSSTPVVAPPVPSKEVVFLPTALEEELKPEEEETYEEWLSHVDDFLSQLEKDRLKRAKFFGKKPSVRGGKGGGRGAGLGDRPKPPAIVLEVKPLPTHVIKQETPTETEEISVPVLAPLQSASSAIIKEEVLSESESPSKESSTPQVTPDVKLEFKERRGSGGKRGGRGRGRGGGPGSRGGRGGRTKKPVFGDGSDFKSPGWEEELYKFKKSLRMPPRLINIPRPPGWPKAPLSLPDLEVYPDSPCTNDSIETFPGKSKIDKDEKKEDKKYKEEDKKSIAKSLGEDQSFLDRLMAKYTARKKKIKKETPTKTEPKEEDIPELLPTPSLHGSKDPSFLGFRKETIQEYRAEFLKTGTFTAEADMPPTILETRTRTENKMFKDRLTIKEVFGTERPASAPPPGTTTDDLRRRQRLRKSKQKEKKKRMMVRAKKEKLQQNSGSAKNKNFRTFRRKLKSSGFDYIRKPKKKIPGPKKDSDHPHKPRKKKIQPMTEEEIEETIKSWTLNKGIGETVLHRASKNGLIDVVRHLLDKLEQDPSPRDNAGYTPLHEACSRGHVAVAHLLLNYGASVEDSALGGVRPLHEAAENGFTKVVRLLLDYGADPLLATYSGATALSLAAADEESRLLMETHIAHNGSVPPSVLDEIASVPKEATLDGFEIEESDFALPTLYRLSGESRVDSWVLFHELASHIKVKTKEALAKILKQDSGTIIRDIKLHDFFAKAHSRAIKSAPPTECPNKTPKLTLVKYTDEIKELLGVETTIIPR